MGQKVNPVGLRVGVNKGWESNWYASSKDFAAMLQKDVKIRNYIAKNLKDASIAKVEINRNNRRTEVKLYTSRPGVVIGRGGEDIEKIKKALKKLVDEDIYLSIIEVKNIDTNAALVAETIARTIENRGNFRSAQKKAIRSAMKAGAKGIKTMVSGRLNGVEMARREFYVEGTVPLHTIRADIDYATHEADTTYGKIGVKVWIYKGEILGNQIPQEEVPERPSRPARNDSRPFRERGAKDVNSEKN